MTIWSLLADRVLGEVEPVEQRRLVEDRRLGRVEVFGLGVADGAAAEADDPAVAVADREHEPVAEPVVVAAAVPRLKQTGLGGQGWIDAAGLEVAEERVPAIGREPEPEALDHLGVQTALVRKLDVRLRRRLR